MRWGAWRDVTAYSRSLISTSKTVFSLRYHSCSTDQVHTEHDFDPSKVSLIRSLRLAGKVPSIIKRLWSGESSPNHQPFYLWGNNKNTTDIHIYYVHKMTLVNKSCNNNFFSPSVSVGCWCVRSSLHFITHRVLFLWACRTVRAESCIANFFATLFCLINWVR